ncbi:MAG TPA: metallophosphoesterase family protein [Anaerolineae bacterium]|nr:metallophosphoesterase family protein [Anaerolineae bacterium]
MKLALLGDIHGNIEALKVAYAAGIERGTLKVFHLGDLGGYAPFVNEVVEFLVEHQIEGVQGNYDEAVALAKEHCGCRYEDDLQAEMAQRSFEWTKEHASEKSKEYMRSLPRELSLFLYGKKVTLFHASPLKNNLYWYEGRPSRFFDEMAARTDADVLIYAHTHIPYRKDVSGRVFINVGSVGKPKDGDTRTCVAMVNIRARGVTVEFVRLPYDVKKVATAIMESGLPPYFADKLRLGR